MNHSSKSAKPNDPVTCWSCLGNGREPLDIRRPCGECGGAGVLPADWMDEVVELADKPILLDDGR